MRKKVIMWAAIAAVVGTIISSLVSANQQKKANERNVRQQQEQWNATNEYNTPLAQRQRLMEAGLNPNLIYGSGTVANTAQNQNLPDTAPISIPDGGQMIGQYSSIVNQSLQNKNLQAQNGVLQAEQAAKAAQTAATLQRTSNDKWTQERSRSLFRYAEEAAGLNIRLSTAKLAEQEIRNSQLPERHKVAMKEAYNRIALARSTMSTQELDRALKREELQLRKQGINPNDPTWLRVVGKQVQELPKVKEKVYKWFENFHEQRQRRKLELDRRNMNRR